MKRIINYIFTTLLIFLPFILSAQDGSLDFLRSTGKIYSVFAVIIVIFIGIIFFIVRLDKKLTKIENQIENGQKTS